MQAPAQPEVRQVTQVESASTDQDDDYGFDIDDDMSTMAVAIIYAVWPFVKRKPKKEKPPNVEEVMRVVFTGGH